MTAHPRRAWARLRDVLPQGLALPQVDWDRRHRAMLLIIGLHGIGIAAFALWQGWDPLLAIGEPLAMVAVGGLAAIPSLGRKIRSSLAALALVVSSALLVQFSGGVIEAHFHFFVIVALITLYQDWVPFLVCIGFVAVDHGVIGTLRPEWVYNHHDAIMHPWKWAGVHASLVLAECAALIVVWRANERAREQTERVLRSAGEGIVGLDREGRVTFANPTALQMLGAAAGQASAIVGSTLELQVTDADGRVVRTGPSLSLVSGTLRGEARLRHATGELDVEVVCTPMEGVAGPEGAVVTLRDLTERRRAEAARLRANAERQELEQLRREDAFKSQFLNMAAHELNTPLTPIRLQLHLLKKNAAPDQPGKGSIQVLDRNFQRLANLVQELLDSSRLQSNQLKVVRSRVALAPLIEETAETFRAPAADSGITLVASPAAALSVEGDPLRLSQVLYNLLSNALKFTPRGGQIEVAVRRQGHEALLEVRDTGVGLSPEQMARLFQPFSQVHESQTSDHRGSGLGLYITKGIVEVHGGRIWVESPGPGQGATFKVALPIVADTDALQSPIPLPAP